MASCKAATRCRQRLRYSAMPMQPTRMGGHTGSPSSSLRFPRAKTAVRGYDADHRAMRVPCFVRDQWTCKQCGWRPDVVRECSELKIQAPVDEILKELRKRYAARGIHLHADHIEQVDQRPDLRLDLSNYQTLCNCCHTRKTVREHGGSRRF